MEQNILKNMSRVDFQNWKDEDDQGEDKEKFEEVRLILDTKIKM